MTLLQWSEWYLEHLGWHTFPVIGKEPPAGFRWVHDVASVSLWERATGIGLITGGRSGVSVVDFDTHANGCPAKKVACSCTCVSADDVAKRLPEAEVVARTPTGGLHYFYSDVDGILPGSQGKAHPQVDTRGRGGYVLIPPSLHDRVEGQYAWVSPPHAGMRLTEVPAVILRALALAGADPSAKRSVRDIYLQGAMTGSRRRHAPALAGAMWRIVADRDKENINVETLEMVLAVLREWNKRLPDPLEDKDLLHVAKSVGRTHYAGLHRPGA